MKTHPSGALEIRRSITIGQAADELSALWRDPLQLATLMRGLVTITSDAPGRSHWTMRGALGSETAWDATLVQEASGQTVEWKSVDRAAWANDLRITFETAPGGQGTEATLVFRFEPPGGVIGEALTQRFAIAPELLVGKVLHRFKALVETGEIPTLEFNTSHRDDAGQPGVQK